MNRINIEGTWKLWLDQSEARAKTDKEITKLAVWMADEPEGEAERRRPNTQADGEIELPGILQAQGYGDDITKETPWVSGLHDARWYEREEYQYAQEDGCKVPFLSQPPKHYIGKAWYEREFVLEEDTKEEWILRIELCKWRSDVWVDGEYKGGDCSLCASHEIALGKLEAGKHCLTICVDNRLQYPYRPDGHGVTDALGMMWNGMVGTVELLTESERQLEWEQKQEAAKKLPRQVEVKDGVFVVDGHPEFFRGTHFAGEFPLLGYPETDEAWWLEKMEILKEWGLNFIRFHSYCPPEAAFAAADKSGIYLQVECAMWNEFSEGIEMLEVLRAETQKVLRQFGHHPSFVLFSPTNEPGGNWYAPLEQWVRETREFDASLGYAKRRVYTAESGWFYDKAPKDVTAEDTDYMYFHRSAYGPFSGGAIRNQEGWHGKDYLPSVEGSTLPIISHELGQWCSYPDFSVKNKFTGYLKGGNYQIFEEQAKAMGLLWRNQEFAKLSGKNQVLMYKEDLEATFRTPHLYGFELLDLHDYLGQGTALVGVLDAFWENKGYVKPEEFCQFCAETVLLARIPSYTYKNTDTVTIPVEVCHFGKEALSHQEVIWELKDVEKDESLLCGRWLDCELPLAKNLELGCVTLDFSCVSESKKLCFVLKMGEVENHWDLYVFAKKEEGNESKVLFCREWREAKQALAEGRSVVFSPYLSALDYNCPAVSMRPAFWNAQMGPAWARNVGLAVQKEHPALAEFLTEDYGGWVWEDILEQARGFRSDCLPEGSKPIVSVIDDWNRNFPLSLVLEARVGAGKLLLVSACLEGSFEERPAAYSLKQSLLAYAASENFCPDVEILPEAVENFLFSVDFVENSAAKYLFEEEKCLVLREGETLGSSNPNVSAYIEQAQFPIHIEEQFGASEKVTGFVYLPDQRDRMHEGTIKECSVQIWQEGAWKEVWRGSFANSYAFQKVTFKETYESEKVRFCVLSAYGCGARAVWKGEREGWRPAYQAEKAVVQAAILAATTQKQPQESDEIFWSGRKKSTTKEIDN
ncbi:MAG: hypothetical protein Q4D90_07295 [bacterium]|nr:hypothetical protein [bacterium]